MKTLRYSKAIEWIYEGASLLKDVTGTKSDYTNKTDCRDVLSDYDAQIEALLSDRIHNLFPHDTVIGEELTHARHGDNIWYIDPIDGTTNFLNQNKNFAISVAYYSCGTPEFGLVLDVRPNLLFHARLKEGAYCNNERIYTAEHSSLSETLLYTPMINHTFLEPHDNRGGLLRLAGDVRAVRSLGSVALELCALASGRADIFVAMRSSPWDHNAARLILEEAGGAMSTLDGKAVPADVSCSILACGSSRLLDQVLSTYMIGTEG